MRARPAVTGRSGGAASRLRSASVSTLPSRANGVGQAGQHQLVGEETRVAGRHHQRRPPPRQVPRHGLGLDHRRLDLLGIGHAQRLAAEALHHGLMVDAEIYAQPWGFPLEEIKVPVRLWHGKKDRSFHWQLAQSLGERFPVCARHMVEGEGHYSLPIRHMNAILADLKSA